MGFVQLVATLMSGMLAKAAVQDALNAKWQREAIEACVAIAKQIQDRDQKPAESRDPPRPLPSHTELMRPKRGTVELSG